MEGDNFVGIVEVLSYMQFIIIIFFTPIALNWGMN